MNFGEALWCKCEFSQGPTRYDRYFYNDSILEIRTLTFNDGDKETEIYLKHDKNLFIIKNTPIKSMPISKLRAMVNQATKHKSANVTRYEFLESGTRYKYVSDNATISYEKKAYGTWGIQPGVYETYLHQGRDIRILREEEEAGVSFNPNYDPSDPNKVYDVVSQMPSYHGGMTALMDFLAKHTKYPEEAKAKGIKGRVIVTFIVERDGSITDIEVVKSVEKSLDEEAIRVIKSMPKWKPGRENNTKVRCKYTLPVTFRLGK
jgi:TonB family protein